MCVGSGIRPHASTAVKPPQSRPRLVLLTDSCRQPRGDFIPQQSRRPASQQSHKTAKATVSSALHRPSRCPASPALVLALLASPPSSLQFVVLKALLRRLRGSHPIVAAGPGQARTGYGQPGFTAHATLMLEGGTHSSAYKLAPTRSLRPDRRS
ncbi:hypothetical protein J3F83DRAFT_554591 [Trichoderma novae-zelandiae]